MVRSLLVFLLQAASLILLPAFSLTQGLLPCPAETQTANVKSITDAATLATELRCSEGTFIVRWYGHVVAFETIYIAKGT